MQKVWQLQALNTWEVNIKIDKNSIAHSMNIDGYYALLGTFFFFFIFVGNLSRIDVVNTFISSVLEKDYTISFVCFSLAISNVPTAILLSRFTLDYKTLLIGVNIKGTSTLIASFVSLITLKKRYTR